MTNSGPENIVAKILEDKRFPTEKKIEVIREERENVLRRLQDAADKDEVNEAKVEAAKVKTLREILEDETKPIEVYVSKIDSKIMVTKFTSKDFLETQHLEYNDYCREALYRMMNRADSTVTKDMLERLPHEQLEAIYDAVDRRCPFLLRQQLERQVLLTLLSYLDSTLLSLKIMLESEKKTSTDIALTSFAGSSSMQEKGNLQIP